jgi:hypothetical protein
MAISRIIIPRVSGFTARSIENAIMDVRIVINDNIIYNYRNCTHSLDAKDLCALYTNLYYDLHQ